MKSIHGGIKFLDSVLTHGSICFMEFSVENPVLKKPKVKWNENFVSQCDVWDLNQMYYG